MDYEGVRSELHEALRILQSIESGDTRLVKIETILFCVIGGTPVEIGAPATDEEIERSFDAYR